MKPACPRAVAWICYALLFEATLTNGAAALPAAWKLEQHFDVAAPGMVKMVLPVDTLDAARPGLEDLRLYDDAGHELPYLIDRPRPPTGAVRNVASFEVSLRPYSTGIKCETGVTQAIDSISVETPATGFIKAVDVDGLAEGGNWQTLVSGKPIFRQPNGLGNLRIQIPKGVWSQLRLRIDDTRSVPVPFTGAQVYVQVNGSVPKENIPVTITSRHENPGETRLTLNLGVANLQLTALQLETSEPLFTRQVLLAVPEVAGDGVRERTLAQGTIYRVAIEGQAAVSNVMLQVEQRVPSREAVLRIRNEDSPPLTVSAVTAERCLEYLVFYAPSSGRHYLLTGNSHCPAPVYDLAALGPNLKNVSPATVRVSSLAENPNYRTPEPLPELADIGTPLNLASWKYRKALRTSRPGPQQLELDLDVLAHAQRGLDDLRLVRSGKQLPYILERTSITRVLVPQVKPLPDPKEPRVSRWSIQLPRSALPIARLACASPTPLFQRELRLYEELRDDRGEKYQERLAQTQWSQTPQRRVGEFTLLLDRPPHGDLLLLETDNGDNPPVVLENFRFFYPATRILFKIGDGENLYLYYGNPEASSPRYDLSLVASQLLAADKSDVAPGPEEQLAKGSWREGHVAGMGGVAFWAVLGLVVLVLLALISRLLPKPANG